MAMAKDASRVKKFGGGILKVITVTDAGVQTTTSATYSDLGYIEETTLSDVTEMEDITDETGNTVASDYATRVVKLSGRFMQSDKDLMDFLKETVRDKYYAVYYLSSKNINGMRQEILAPICRIKPSIELTSGTKRIPFEITILENQSAITFGAAAGNIDLPSGAYATTGSVTANTYYSIVETAVT